MTKLIERNTTIPTRKSEVFTTAEDNQPSVEVHVLQGETEMAAYNKTLGKFQLVGIPPAPRGVPQVEVAFDIDANGIINVSAKDLGTGNEQQIKIEGGSGLKEDEVADMIKNAEAHAEEAHKLRELADARNEAEGLAYQTEKSLKEHRDKLDASVASTVEGRIMELRGVLESGDVAEIRAKRDALQEAWSDAASAIYAQASASTPVRRRRPGVRRRGDRGRRLRGRRRRRRGKDVLNDDSPWRIQRRSARGGGQRRLGAGRRPGRRACRRDRHADQAARRVSRRAPASEGRVRQLPQAGCPRPGDLRRAGVRAAGRPVAPDARRSRAGGAGGRRAR